MTSLLRPSLLLLGLGLLQPVVAQTTPAKTEEVAEPRYTASSKRFSLPVPAGWKNISGEKFGLRDNIFTHPKPTNNFAVNVVFIEEEVAAAASLGELVDSNVAGMKGGLTGFKTIEKKSLQTASGSEIVRLRYQANILPGGVTCKNVVYFVRLKDHRLLSISVSGIAATPAEHLEEAETAILKIEITK